jgi:outer membrane protein insertion porin family
MTWGKWGRGLAGIGLVLVGILAASAVATFSVATATVAVAQGAGAIVVEGNRRVEADTIRSYFRRSGGSLDEGTINEALKELYATGLFQDVRINRAGGRIVVTVVENPVINRVAFEGNKKVKDEQLTGELQSKARGTLSRPLVQADTQRIIEMYRRSGRFDVRVEPKIIELPNNRVDLVFEVTEGNKTGVKRVLFVGNNAYTDFRLKDVIRTGESNLLSFIKNNDLYDPDRIEADRELLRRFYLKHGFADIRIVAAVAEYDPARQGFIVTFTIDEGDRYRFGAVDVISNVAVVDPVALRGKLKAVPGAIYNAEAVEKTVEDLSVEVAKRGYAFANIRPRAERDFAGHVINVAFVIEEGARAYIERLNIRGNIRTRDYVIRREFDLGEGDAYNRALIDRAERRLKNLNYFKTVKITNEPGSAPDRVVVNVDVEEQSTGEFSIAGGYSTADGFMGEVSIGERNLLGLGQYAKAALQYGQRARGFELSFAEPFFLGYRLAAGIDLFAKQSFASNYVSYDSTTVGASTRLGFSLREDLGIQLRYSIYRQEVSLPPNLNNCTPTTAPTSPLFDPKGFNCYSDGEASLAIRKELANGPVHVSMLGYSLIYNSVDNNKSPTKGIFAEFKQDFAGIGGDVNFIRSTVDSRTYYEVIPDIVGVLRLQGGNISPWGNRDLRMLDHFQLGPTLVRGFAPAGLGPRDITVGTIQDALGGTNYWGASLEFQVPFYFLPKDSGVRGAVYADAGSLWDYKGPTTFPQTRETLIVDDSNVVRSSVGAGLIWDSPFGPLRFDYSFPLTKGPNDRIQQFRFGGGTKF